MNLRWLFPFLKAESSEVETSEAETSDFGRVYGWLAENDGEVVAKLDYLCWDEDSQWWHQYKLTILRPDMVCLASDRDAWRGITLRNAKFTDVTEKHFLVYIHSEDEYIIAIRGASVPEDRFKKQ